MMVKETLNLLTKISRWLFTLGLFYFVPLIAEGKKCEQGPIGWGSAPITIIVQECYKKLDMISRQQWGAPIRPDFGLAQCACVVDYIRTEHFCQEDYNTFANENPNNAGIIITKYSEQCIKDGAMGPNVKKHYLENEQKNQEQQETSTPKEEKKSPSWNDILNK